MRAPGRVAMAPSKPTTGTAACRTAASRSPSSGRALPHRSSTCAAAAVAAASVCSARSSATSAAARAACAPQPHLIFWY